MVEDSSGTVGDTQGRITDRILLKAWRRDGNLHFRDEEEEEEEALAPSAGLSSAPENMVQNFY